MGKWPCTRTPEDVSGDAVAMTTVSAVHVDAAATLRTEQASAHQDMSEATLAQEVYTESTPWTLTTY